MAHTGKNPAPDSILPEDPAAVRIAPAEKLAPVPAPSAAAEDAPGHPDPRLLDLFLRGELSGPEGREPCRMIVRHLLAGCPHCSRLTGRLDPRRPRKRTGPLVD